MKNTVIANRKKTDWKIIKKYFEDRGVDINGANGTSFLIWPYYGMIDGEFSCYSLETVQQANAKILEVSDIEKEFNVGDIVVGWHNAHNKDRLYEVPWEIERIDIERYIYPKGKPKDWCCGVSHIRHATPEEIKQYNGISDTVTLPKALVLQAHKEACPDWKKRIEEVVPELFPKKMELEVGKWYKIPEMNFIMCYKGKGGGYGFNSGNQWGENYAMISDSWQPATESEVFEALKNEAVKRGLWGVPIIGVTGDKGTHKMYDEYFKSYNNRLWSEYEIVFQDGEWAELISQPIPKKLQSLIDKHGKEEIIKMLK